MGQHSANGSQVFHKEKAVLIALLVLLFLALLTLPVADAQAYNRTSAILLIDAESGEVLHEENADLKMEIASTTKILTAITVIENADVLQRVRIPKRAVGVEGSSIYLKEGEKLTVKDLLYGLMLRSGNDSAVALALHLGGTEEHFVKMMNIRAEMLGLNDTHYANPHGLHDENHYTSCYDLCKLGCIAMKNPLFKEIVSTKKITIGEKESQRSIANKKKILFQYEGGNGIKTGYTRAAGRCLVSAAERKGVQLVAAVLNVPDMFGVCSSLMDYGFTITENRA